MYKIFFLGIVGIVLVSSCGESSTNKQNQASIDSSEIVINKSSTEKLIDTEQVCIDCAAQSNGEFVICGKNEAKEVLTQDFSQLWLGNDNILGFIGSNYQRIKVYFLSIKKTSDSTYEAHGVTSVKNNICNFNGLIHIKCLFENTYLPEDGTEEKYSYVERGVKKRGFLLAKYKFCEDEHVNSTGIFEGELTTYWYLDKYGKLQYNDIEGYGDGYCNNQYEGTWTSYKTGKSKICNWGDFRIPNCGDLDYGAGEFSPAPEYKDNGWSNYDEELENVELRNNWWKK